MQSTEIRSVLKNCMHILYAKARIYVDLIHSLWYQQVCALPLSHFTLCFNDSFGLQLCPTCIPGKKENWWKLLEIKLLKSEGIAFILSKSELIDAGTLESSVYTKMWTNRWFFNLSLYSRRLLLLLHQPNHRAR